MIKCQEKFTDLYNFTSSSSITKPKNHIASSTTKILIILLDNIQGCKLIISNLGINWGIREINLSILLSFRFSEIGLNVLCDGIVYIFQVIDSITYYFLRNQVFPKFKIIQNNFLYFVLL